MPLQGKKERHLLLAWPSAVENYSEQIANFEREMTNSIISKLCIHISDAEDMNNLLNCLYGEKLKGRDYKLKEVGIGTLNVYIIYVDSDYSRKVVTSGFNLVNDSMHFIKSDLRIKCGGGHNIHGSEDLIEAEDDAMLFFGKSMSEITSEDDKDISFSEWADSFHNIIGSIGLLSQTGIRHSILRGVTEREQSFGSDIDFLIEEKDKISVRKRLRIYPKYPKLVNSRVYVSLKEKKEIDLRYVEDDYLPIQLTQELFDESKNHQEKSANVYNESQIKALAYHCLVHKNNIHIKYIGFLEGCTSKIELARIFQSGHYDVKPCSDITVGYFNYKCLKGKKPSLNRVLFWNYVLFRRLLKKLVKTKDSNFESI
ncbi:hypothetical protein L2D39_12970 [Vibrio harveyi]|uniref:hypothetical protein n=1 Tax=Vibrio harveyi TaxID=669 RepID=UPI000A172080|nr:hypothetical protein [Vibrio harveyi]HDM8200157.1 hypothetical protein [Vibrio harveyi]